MGTVKFFRHSTKLSRYYIPTEFVVVAIIEFLVLVFSLYLALEIRFWDGDWPANGDRLTEISKVYGECNLYIGDDGKVYSFQG